MHIWGTNCGQIGISTSFRLLVTEQLSPSCGDKNPFIKSTACSLINRTGHQCLLNEPPSQRTTREKQKKEFRFPRNPPAFPDRSPDVIRGGDAFLGTCCRSKPLTSVPLNSAALLQICLVLHRD